MAPAPSRTAAASPTAPPRSAVTRAMEAGQALLFVALLGIGTARAWSDGAGWVTLVLAAAVLAVFAGGLAVHTRIGDLGRAVWVVATLVGAVALFAHHRDFLWLAFPVWLLAAHVLSLPLALALTAVSLAAVITVLGYQGDSSSAATLGPVIGALVAVGLSQGVRRLERESAEHRRLLQEVMTAQRELVVLSDELVRAQRDAGVLAERTRLSRDIHDTLAQGFSSIVLLARAAQREADADRRDDLLSLIRGTAQDNLAQSRRVVHALAPEELDADGLASPLRRLAADLETATGATVTVAIDPQLPRLPIPTEVALLRAAQGSLANVRRHSRASAVTVSLARDGDRVRLDVVDDGCGFDPGALVTSPHLEGGYGLIALRDRLRDLGGGLAIESEPGRGTALSADLPLRGDV